MSLHHGGYAWQPEEVEILRDALVSEETFADALAIASRALPGRSYEALRGRAARLPEVLRFKARVRSIGGGIRQRGSPDRNNYPRSGYRWSNEEQSILESALKNCTTITAAIESVVAAIPLRSPDSIYARAYHTYDKIRLECKVTYTDEKCQEIWSNPRPTKAVGPVTARPPWFDEPGFERRLTAGR